MKTNKNVLITGIDISQKAFTVARDNRKANDHVLGTNLSVLFKVGDIFTRDLSSMSNIDIIVSNPPYVSEENYYSWTHTERSVRNYEPRLALIGGVEFYKRIFEIATTTNAKAVVCEISDGQQYRDILDANCVDSSLWCSGSMYDEAGVVRTIVSWRRDAEDEWGWLQNLIS